MQNQASVKLTLITVNGKQKKYRNSAMEIMG